MGAVADHLLNPRGFVSKRECTSRHSTPQHTIHMSGSIAFPARKRRAAEAQEPKPPSDRIARKKLLAALDVQKRKVANASHTPAPATGSEPHGGVQQENSSDTARTRNSEHNPELQDQEDGSEGSVLLGLQSTVNGLHSNMRQKACGHAIEGSGNSLLLLGQSGAQRDTWQIQSTMYEMHTPKLERREV